eukprot:Nk52_evm22s250 gene=Nk52_evmTU22s250
MGSVQRQGVFTLRLSVRFNSNKVDLDIAEGKSAASRSHQSLWSQINWREEQFGNDATSQAQRIDQLYSGSKNRHKRNPQKYYGEVTHLPGYGAVGTEERHDAGYVDISQNEGDENNMFYWLVGPQNTTESHYSKDDFPLVIFLQGGPGASSLDGFFLENGPFRLCNDVVEEGAKSFNKSAVKLCRNEDSWNRNAYVLYVDEPAGTGFSFTKRYAQNDKDVGRDFVVFLTRFFERYEYLKKTKLFIFGESYAGKFIPAIVHEILFGSGKGVECGNLKGIGIGNAWTDPIVQTGAYADWAYANGLCDLQQKKRAYERHQQCMEELGEGLFVKAASTCYGSHDIILREAGNPNFYDIRTFKQYDFEAPGKYLNLPEVKKALHVEPNHNWSGSSGIVVSNLRASMLTSALPLMKDILNYSLDCQTEHCKRLNVLLYNGQFDMCANIIGMDRMYTSLDWSGKEQFNRTPSKLWKVDGKVRGYVRNYDIFSRIIIVGAGHLSPMDQPVSTLRMVETFIYGQEF